MSEFQSLDGIFLLLVFLVPGLVTIYVRARFTTGRMPSLKDSSLAYLAISAFYYAALLPFVDVLVALPKGLLFSLICAVIIFIGPAVVGMFLGWNAQRGTIRWLLDRIRLPIVHPMPTAWDWRFATLRKTYWVYVTLKDGSRIVGMFAGNSFAASDPNERDIYLEKVYAIDDEDNLIDQGDIGILILAGEISHMAFRPIME